MPIEQQNSEPFHHHRVHQQSMFYVCKKFMTCTKVEKCVPFLRLPWLENKSVCGVVELIFDTCRCKNENTEKTTVCTT